MKWYDWFFDCVKNKYFMFDGRARRSEYWYYTLVWAIIYLVLLAFSAIPVVGFFASLIRYVFSFALFFPSLGVLVRRLHDTNRSGWWALLLIIPFGFLVLIIFCVLDSDRLENRYGKNPKV